jgi:ABC-2 type transport system ATP-binding protein
MQVIKSQQPVFYEDVGPQDPRHNPEMVRALVEAGAEIQFVGELRQRLEDVYLQLVNR